ncbi:Protein TRI1 [Candida viswanathii]|uniref:Protein TRI1 n=1 Tax=Candida viswanathii TaxID=5486 RepID=A0A367XR15_9ASCO|nr:Protein TRI1 [Candida viswanathii]
MSTDFDPDKYLPTIDAILSVANLEEVTVKRIRNALQELFGVDLSQDKKQVNELILNRYQDLAARREKEEKLTKQEMERQDALLAAKLSREENERLSKRASRNSTTTTSSSSSSTARSKTSPPKRKRKPLTEAQIANNPFNREMYLSPELAAIIGVEKTSRPKVVKLLWSYIKDNNLQNPKDKRQIECDNKLHQLFKKKNVGSFEMNKLLSKHIFKPEDWDETPASSQAGEFQSSQVNLSEPIITSDDFEDVEPSSEEE